MSNCLNMTCPACGSSKKIQIEVRLWIDLCDDDFEIVDESYAAAWKPDGADGAACLACDWRGTIDDLGSADEPSAGLATYA